MSDNVKLKWKTWLYSIMSAGIGSAATSGTAMLVDPVAFNLGDLSKLGKLFAAGFLVGVMLVLKKSPLPDQETDTETKL